MTLKSNIRLLAFSIAILVGNVTSLAAFTVTVHVHTKDATEKMGDRPSITLSFNYENNIDSYKVKDDVAKKLGCSFIYISFQSPFQFGDIKYDAIIRAELTSSHKEAQKIIADFTEKQKIVAKITVDGHEVGVDPHWRLVDLVKHIEAIADPYSKKKFIYSYHPKFSFQEMKRLRVPIVGDDVYMLSSKGFLSDKINYELENTEESLLDLGIVTQNAVGTFVAKETLYTTFCERSSELFCLQFEANIGYLEQTFQTEQNYFDLMRNLTHLYYELKTLRDGNYHKLAEYKRDLFDTQLYNLYVKTKEKIKDVVQQLSPDNLGQIQKIVLDAIEERMRQNIPQDELIITKIETELLKITERNDLAPNLRTYIEGLPQVVVAPPAHPIPLLPHNPLGVNPQHNVAPDLNPPVHPNQPVNQLNPPASRRSGNSRGAQRGIHRHARDGGASFAVPVAVAIGIVGSALVYKYRKAINDKLFGKKNTLEEDVAELVKIEQDFEEDKLAYSEYLAKKDQILQKYSDEDVQKIKAAVAEKIQ